MISAGYILWIRTTSNIIKIRSNSLKIKQISIISKLKI